MQWRPDPFFHLTYCTNIHAGESWDAVLASLRTHALPLKQRLAPDRPFGLGLRLSDVAARELLEGDRLAEFKTFLDENGLYVAIINGFPFGAFHNRVIKQDVFAPDWRTEERVQYTLNLVQILSALLPENLDGGISTSPLSYKDWVRAAPVAPENASVSGGHVAAGHTAKEFIPSSPSNHVPSRADGVTDTEARAAEGGTPSIGGGGGEPAAFQADEAALACMIGNIVRAVEPMARLRRETGKWIHLDIEPEPDGLIENSPETVAFFQQKLLPLGAPLLAQALDLPLEEAETCLFDHVQICYDTCHFAVAYEDTAATLKRFADAGIRIGRIQVSSALKVLLPPEEAVRETIRQRLEPFAESTYLHQVLERRETGPLRHFPDLPAALPEIGNPEALEWRIHYHVPLFVADYGAFGSTQAEIVPVLEAVERTRFTGHLEIETYTWDVLPADLKVDMLESIEREYHWVMAQFPPG